MFRTLHLVLVLLALAGCQERRSTALDPDRLLHMAGEEAGQVKAPRERLTRQLNIANRQIENGRAGEARQTLSAARETIRQADRDALGEHDRLSGWISLCELSRGAGDAAFANASLDQALAVLNELNPHPERCQYVLGVEREVRALRGEREAVRLLTTASDWAVEIPAEGTRRSAFLAFAEELCRCGDYEAARGMLRRDADAAWRSDALTALSDRARVEAQAMAGSWGSKAVAYSASEAQSSPLATMERSNTSSSSRPVRVGPFGKPLDFRSNYYRP
ncbi:MAG TPA: hypothetical protein VH475_29355 [Tepidisphaeraceae bacterium]|jgi:hypothetical protein